MKREEVGKFKYIGGLTVKGSYEYIGDDNQTYIISYEADERGYRPSKPMLKNWRWATRWIINEKTYGKCSLSIMDDLYQFIRNHHEVVLTCFDYWQVMLFFICLSYDCHLHKIKIEFSFMPHDDTNDLCVLDSRTWPWTERDFHSTTTTWIDAMSILIYMSII